MNEGGWVVKGGGGVESFSPRGSLASISRVFLLKTLERLLHLC